VCPLSDNLTPPTLAHVLPAALAHLIIRPINTSLWVKPLERFLYRSLMNLSGGS